MPWRRLEAGWPCSVAAAAQDRDAFFVEQIGVSLINCELRSACNLCGIRQEDDASTQLCHVALESP